MTARRLLSRARACGCNNRPKGAGFVALPDMFRTTGLDLANALAGVNEANLPVGTIAHLAEPFEVDRGINQAPRMVDRFVKRSNGNWLSYPGNEVYYTSLANLNLDAKVARLEWPAGVPQPEPEPTPLPQRPADPRAEPQTLDYQPGNDPRETPSAEPEFIQGWPPAAKIALALAVPAGTAILGAFTFWGAKKILKA